MFAVVVTEYERRYGPHRVFRHQVTHHVGVGFAADVGEPINAVVGDELGEFAFVAIKPDAEEGDVGVFLLKLCDRRSC